MTTARSKRRRFQVWRNHAIPDGSCFLLTERGVEFARQLAVGGQPEPDRPFWDGKALRWGETIIKTPAAQAKSQRQVLAECQRCGWVNPIDLRPLVPDSVDRTHWAVNMARNLNHGLTRIRFHADGSKHAITWERLE